MDSSPTFVDTELPGANELPPPPSRPPPVTGYELLEELGRGGMGVVYRARQTKLNREVALKLLRTGALARPAERERFLREARAAARLQHPNIVQVFDVGEHAGIPYLALEYSAGGSLAKRLADGPLPPNDAAQLVESLALAVQAAHAHGVVHRDLKPANILMAKSSTDIAGDTDSKDNNRSANQTVSSAESLDKWCPKIADFGLARLSADESGNTATGVIVGTPSYMAPEQVGSARDAGPNVDIYALGAILYECLTGRPPFRAATLMETLDQVRTAEPVPPIRMQPAVPRDLNTICLKCLKKEPAKRYISAAALAEDLRRFLIGMPVLARPLGTFGRAWRWCRRNPRVAGLLAALGVVLVAGFIAVYDQWQRADRLYVLAEARRATAVGQQVAAEANLHRYEQAADDFALLLDRLETDQLFHLRSDPLRPELVIPALRRNQEFIKKHGDNPSRQGELVQAHFRVSVLTRLLSSGSGDKQAYQAPLDACRKALAVLTAFAGEQPDVVQYRRDRAALTQNLGFLLHATGRSTEGVLVLEDACRQRQALFDAQRDHLDYRSELGSCWNDLGLALFGAQRYSDAVAAHERAIELQQAAVEAAPQVPRYWRHLCNHHYNKATAMARLSRATEAAEAAAQGRKLVPHEPEYWFREARVLAILSGKPGGKAFADSAIAALKRSTELGFENLEQIDTISDFGPIQSRPEFKSIRDELARKKAGLMSQAP